MPEHFGKFCIFVRLQTGIVNQENNNFGLHQFFEATFLSESKTLSIANLC
jgi:hypothetical protein